MKNFLRSLALVTVASMGMTAVNAGGEWKQGSEKCEQTQHTCTAACKAKCARLNRAINSVRDPQARAELHLMLKHKMCMHKKLEWLDKNMCSKCKRNCEKHDKEMGMKKGEKTCTKCSTCKRSRVIKHKHTKHTEEVTEKN